MMPIIPILMSASSGAGPTISPGARQPLEQHPADQHTEKISQRIPVNLKAENREGHLVDGGKGQGSPYRRVQIVRCKQIHATIIGSYAKAERPDRAPERIEKRLRMIRFARFHATAAIMPDTVAHRRPHSPNGGVIGRSRESLKTGKNTTLWQQTARATKYSVLLCRFSDGLLTGDYLMQVIVPINPPRWRIRSN